MSDHIPLSVPAVPADFKPSDELTSEQQEKLENVLEHFSNSEYTIPGLEKDAAFTENEKFWLVSFPLTCLSSISFRFLI